MEIISLVEKGWTGARQVTIDAVCAGHSVRHFVRGKLPRTVLEVLTPYPNMRIQGYSPRWYRMVVWGALVRRTLSMSTPLVLVDNERALRWVTRWFSWWRNRVVLVPESLGAPLLLTPSGEPIDRQQWLAMLA